MRLCLLMCSNDRTLRQQVLSHRLALRNGYLDVCQSSTSEQLITQTVTNCRQNSKQNIAVVWITYSELECGPMTNLMAALPNIGGALCSTPQSLADAHY